MPQSRYSEAMTDPDEDTITGAEALPYDADAQQDDEDMS